MTNHFDKKLMSFATDVAEGKITVAAAPPPKPMTKFEGDVTVPRTPGLGKIQAEQTLPEGEKLDEILGLGGDIAAIYRDWKKWRASKREKAGGSTPAAAEAPKPIPKTGSLMDALRKKAEGKHEAKPVDGHDDFHKAKWGHHHSAAVRAMRNADNLQPGTDRHDAALQTADDHKADRDRHGDILKKRGYRLNGGRWVK